MRSDVAQTRRTSGAHAAGIFHAGGVSFSATVLFIACSTISYMNESQCESVSDFVNHNTAVL